MAHRSKADKRAYERAYYAAHAADPTWRQKMREATHRWRRDNPEKVRASRRKTLLRFKYGLTQEQYEQRLTQQTGRCAACGDLLTTTTRAPVDHDHVTGEIRGIICGACNLALGHAQDSPARLDLLAAYLKRERVAYLQKHAR